MHYYQFNIGDYMSHTSHLSELEDLAYRRLLDYYYMQENPIPNDTNKVARLIRMRDRELEIGQVLEEFFTLDGELWRHKRVDSELDKYRAKADAARENGKKGGRPKKPSNNPEETQSVNLANPAITQPKAKQEPLTINQEPSINPPANTGPIGIKRFLENCSKTKEKPIPPDDPIFVYMKDIGLPRDWLLLCWREFVEINTNTEKRYKDWRKAFRNCVRANWYKLWYVDSGTEELRLSSQGQIAQKKHKGAK